MPECKNTTGLPSIFPLIGQRKHDVLPVLSVVSVCINYWERSDARSREKENWNKSHSEKWVFEPCVGAILGIHRRNRDEYVDDTWNNFSHIRLRVQLFPWTLPNINSLPIATSQRASNNSVGRHRNYPRDLLSS